MVLISGVISDRYQWRGYTVVFSSLLSLIGFVMFYGIVNPSTGAGSLSNACGMHNSSEYIKPCSLCLPLFVYSWRILCRAQLDHMAFKQQRATHPTRDRRGLNYLCRPGGRYPLHLALRISLFRAGLHGGDDHIHHYVRLHGGLFRYQLVVPVAGESVEGGTEREDEQRGRARGAWRSECVVYIQSIGRQFEFKTPRRCRCIADLGLDVATLVNDAR